MKVKTADLIGAALDWAVAKCDGYDEWEWDRDVSDLWVIRRSTQTEHWLKGYYEPSTDWAQGGPIIDREKFGVCHYNESDGWEVPNWAAWRTDVDDRVQIMGETALIAAMRCFVASKLGDEVDVPEGLVL